MRVTEIIKSIERIKNMECISDLVSIVEGTAYSVDIDFFLCPERAMFFGIKEIQIYLSVSVLDAKGKVVMYWPENADYNKNYDESFGLVVNDLVGSYNLKNHKLITYCLENDEEFLSEMELIIQKTKEISTRS